MKLSTQTLMESMIENLVNGNVTMARKQARRYAIDSIRAYCVEVYGWSENKSSLTAIFLKSGTCWQQFCDAK